MKLLISLLTLLLSASAQISPDTYSNLHWRSLGPQRAGRISAVAGVPSQPNIYYVGTPAGGVWKTDDAGQTWKPIFDATGVPSIGAIAVSPSNPNIIYVGTGEMYSSSGGSFPGKGVYKSTDAGKTWASAGLTDTHLISRLCVDPKNPDIILAGSTGDPFSGPARGIYKSTDGGRSWKHVFFKDNDTAVVDLHMAFGNPKMMYASTQKRAIALPTGPPNPAARREQDGGIYRSTDEGSTWTQVAAKGLPAEPWGRIGIVAFPGAKSKVAYALTNQGFFRSDDMGDNWQQTSHDPRVVSSGYFGEIFIDPNDGNSVYVGQTSMYRTTDGGKTFTAAFGAPSGDDYHLLWINPANSQYMMAGVDQGAIISVNHGATWSSWYNMANGQFYHISTDNQFPYHIFAAQQDSGAVDVVNRSYFGEITYRDWSPPGAFEFSFIEVDPLHRDVLYAGGWYGSVIRFDRVTGQGSPVFVRTPKYRTSNMAPIAFSPQNHKSLFVGSQFVVRSEDGGSTWAEISPDLTKMEVPANATPQDRARANNGNISTMALSHVAENLIWVGTSNGVVQVSRDAKTWENVTPPGLPERSTINAVEASPHDAGTAFAVVNAFRDNHPLIYRTTDFGKSWQKIVTGLPDDYIARIVREDPARKGLLYGGTENGAWISFDNGDHWQSFQLDMPFTSVRDMTIHGDDLVVATYGRSLYILDDVTPLRQLSAQTTGASAHLFTPQKAMRVRWDNNGDTPLPIETPASDNPPDGAIIDYYLSAPLTAADAANMKLQIFDSAHNLVREYTTTPAPHDTAPKNVPDYWFEPNAALTNKAGINRFVWDLRYDPPQTLRYAYFGGALDYIEYTLADHTIPGHTPHQFPMGSLAVPGDYTVELTIGKEKFTKPLTIVIDPNVHVTNADLQAQLETERNIAAQMATTYSAYNQLTAIKKALDEAKKSLPSTETKTSASLRVPSGRVSHNRDGGSVETESAPGNVPHEIESGDDPEADALAEQTPQQPETKPTDPVSALDAAVTKLRDGSGRELGFGPLNRELARLANMISEGDGRPAGALVDAVNQSCKELAKRVAEWKDLAGSPSSPLTAGNIYLHDHKLAAVPALTDPPSPPSCK